MLKFHPLSVLQVTPDAEDAVSLALEVPAELRVAIEGEDLRRTY